MGRLVDPGGPSPADRSNVPQDTYSDRLVKYLPAESVAVFLSANILIVSSYGLSIDGSTTKPDDGWLFPASIIVFAIVLVATPIYLRSQRSPGKPWVVNTVVATVGFVVWAYSIGGSLFLASGTYVPLLGSLAALLFTFVVPAVFKPSPK